MEYKVRMITRENDPDHPAAKEYFDAESSRVLIVESGKDWWYAKRFLTDLYFREKKEKDFNINID